MKFKLRKNSLPFLSPCSFYTRELYYKDQSYIRKLFVCPCCCCHFLYLRFLQILIVLLVCWQTFGFCNLLVVNFQWHGTCYVNCFSQFSCFYWQPSSRCYGTCAQLWALWNMLHNVFHLVLVLYCYLSRYSLCVTLLVVKFQGYGKCYVMCLNLCIR